MQCCCLLVPNGKFSTRYYVIVIKFYYWWIFPLPKFGRVFTQTNHLWSWPKVRTKALLISEIMDYGFKQFGEKSRLLKQNLVWRRRLLGTWRPRKKSRTKRSRSSTSGWWNILIIPCNQGEASKILHAMEKINFCSNPSYSWWYNTYMLMMVYRPGLWSLEKDCW